MDDSSRRFTRQEVLSDMFQLLNILTEAHPDPFMNIGSQVKFYSKVDKILFNLPEEINVIQMHSVACKIVALLADSHTYMEGLDNNGTRIWIEFEPIDEKLIVMGVYESRFSNLIGYSLQALNGVPIESLLTRMLEIRSANWVYDNLIHVADALKDPHMASLLIGKGNGNIKEIKLTLASPEGDPIQNIVFTFSPDPPGDLIQSNSLNFSISSKSEISYKILDEGVGYLRIKSMVNYRESYESMLKSGASEYFLKEILQEYGYGENERIDEIISKTPSASESIIELLRTMKDEGIMDLVVDLRNNNGGNSYLAYILAYFLYGTKSLEIDEGYDINRYSVWYKKQYDLKENIELIQGYDFQEMHKWLSGKRELSRDSWEEIISLSPTFAKYYTGFSPTNGIRVYVLCSARTFSAGFDLLITLKKLGATVVGIQPAQPANAFTNTISFSLNISGLKGHVSSKLMVKYPKKPIFYIIKPDISIGLEIFKKRGYHPNTILMEALDMIHIN
jgi:hypothetical protein